MVPLAARRKRVANAGLYFLAVDCCAVRGEDVHHVHVFSRGTGRRNEIRRRWRELGRKQQTREADRDRFLRRNIVSFPLRSEEVKRKPFWLLSKQCGGKQLLEFL